MSDGSQYFKGSKIITKALLLSRLQMESYRHRVKVDNKLLSCAYNKFHGMGILDHNGSDYNISGQNRSLRARNYEWNMYNVPFRM